MVKKCRIIAQWHLIVFLVCTTGVSFKAGKFNVTTTLSLLTCKNVSFEEPFIGGQEIKIFISKSHATKSSTRGNGAAIWVESVNNKAFTVCVLEYGDGSSGTSQVNWMALQSVPTGGQLGTASLNAWTTGTKCKRIAFEKVRFVQFIVLLISFRLPPMEKISLFCFNLHTYYFICLLIKSARVTSFTIFDNVVVVAIAARKVLHVFLVLPCYVILHFSVFVIFFLRDEKFD